MKRRDFAKNPDPYWNVPRKPSKAERLRNALLTLGALVAIVGALPFVAAYSTRQIKKVPVAQARKANPGVRMADARKPKATPVPRETARPVVEVSAPVYAVSNTAP